MEPDNSTAVFAIALKVVIVWLWTVMGFITPVLQALVLLASLVYTIVQIRIAILKLRETKAHHDPD